MKKPVFYVVTAFFLLPLLGCQSDSQKPQSADAKGGDQEKSESLTIPPDKALSLMEIHCNGCHNPKAPSHDELKSPPMVAAKFRYKQSYPEREAFIKHMADFLENPSREDALMPKAVERFGAKFKTSLSRAQLEAISAYIYDEQLEEPDWFAEHFEEEYGKEWKQ